MKLYHGTKYSSALTICREGIDLAYSKQYLDFGPGFYAIPSYRHAAFTAIRRTDARNKRYRLSEEPYIVQFHYNHIKEKGILIRSFRKPDAEWGRFILSNRLEKEKLQAYHITEHNQDSRYDICVGEIADGAMVNCAYRVNAGERKPGDIKYTEFLKENGRAYPLQYSFHTEKGLACISDLNCGILQNKERYIKMIRQDVR